MEYLLLGAFVLLMNVIPAFMPPTWMVLVFFFLTFKLSPIPVVLIGALSATLGRITLYSLARYKFLPHLPKHSQKNYETFGKLFHVHKKITIPALLAYAFLPIPSNQVYIAAGFAQIRIKLIASIFFLGRVISYSSWIATAHLASSQLTEIFERHLFSKYTLIVELLGFSLIYLISLFDWNRMLKKMSKK